MRRKNIVLLIKYFDQDGVMYMQFIYSKYCKINDTFYFHNMHFVILIEIYFNIIFMNFFNIFYYM